MLHENSQVTYQTMKNIHMRRYMNIFHEIKYKTYETHKISLISTQTYNFSNLKSIQIFIHLLKKHTNV